MAIINGAGAGGGGASLPTATGPNQVPASTGAGTTYTALSAADLRQVTVGPLSDAMDGAGWSAVTPSGGAAASWETSPARLALDCDPGAAGSCGVTADGYVDSGDYYDVAIRVQVVSGDNSSQTRIILAVGQDTDNSINLALFTDGSIEVGAVVATSYTFWSVSSTIAAIDAGVRTGGELWLRTHRSPGLIECSWGVGSGGALPTAWNPVYTSIEREVAGQYGQAKAGLTASNGRSVGIYAITLSGVDLDVDVLSIVTALPGGFGGE